MAANLFYFVLTLIKVSTELKKNPSVPVLFLVILETVQLLAPQNLIWFAVQLGASNPFPKLVKLLPSSLHACCCSTKTKPKMISAWHTSCHVPLFHAVVFCRCL